MDKSLISGSTSMLILRLLEDRDMYGYEMIETLETKSNNVFTLKAGTLYPLLHTLEEKNYLTSYESEANGKYVSTTALQRVAKIFEVQKGGVAGVPDSSFKCIRHGVIKGGK